MVRRGDVVIAVFSGDYGKPRPAVVVQTDLANPTHSRLGGLSYHESSGECSFVSTRSYAFPRE